MVTFEGLLEAYFDCRVHKSRTNNCIRFSTDVESRLLDMVNSINNRTYSPTRSICFVVSRPKYREVFAADFADRIIHHYIRLRLEPLIELEFNDRTYNCRTGKGTLAGIKQLEKDIKECSNNYTEDCYVASVDIQSFFMSIPKKEVEDIVMKFVEEKYNGDDKDDLLFLCHVVLSNDPEKNCIKQSSESMWKHLPPNKSLFTNGEGLGMPIGNLPSQMFANFLLNDVDWAIENECGIKCHGRYVDDIYMVAKTKEQILNTIPIIRSKLKNHGLTLSNKKFYMQHYSKGIDFTGAIVKPGRTYVINRVVTSFRKSIANLNKSKNKWDVIKSLPSVNSYLGLTRQFCTYAIRQNVLREIEPRLFKWLYIKGHFEVLSIKKKYNPNRRIRYRLRKGYKDKMTLPEEIASFSPLPGDEKYDIRMKEYKPVRIKPLRKLERKYSS